MLLVLTQTIAAA